MTSELSFTQATARVTRMPAATRFAVLEAVTVAECIAVHVAGSLAALPDADIHDTQQESGATCADIEAVMVWAGTLAASAAHEYLRKLRDGIVIPA